MTNGNGTMNAAFGSGNELKANGKTIFLVKNSTGDYNVYTGIKEVPTIVLKSTVSSAVKVNSYVETNAVCATVVFIDAENFVDVTSTKTIFVFYKSSVKVTEDGKIGSYYEYDAIIDGEITKLKVSTSSAATLIAGGKPAVYNTISYNADGIADLGTALGYYAVGTEANKNGVIGIGGSYYNFTKDVKVFYINTNNEILTSSINAIAKDSNDDVWYNIDNNEVNYVFIKEVAGNSTGPVSNYDFSGSATIALGSGSVSLNGLTLKDGTSNVNGAEVKVSFEISQWVDNAWKVYEIKSTTATTASDGTFTATAATTLPSSAQWKVVATASYNTLVNDFTAVK